MNGSGQMTATANVISGGLLWAATGVLAALKIGGVLNIGWLAVFAPIWIPLLVLAVMVILILICGGLVLLGIGFTHQRDKNRVRKRVSEAVKRSGVSR